MAWFIEPSSLNRIRGTRPSMHNKKIERDTNGGQEQGEENETLLRPFQTEDKSNR
jgi:hypothetical protein